MNADAIEPAEGEKAKGAVSKYEFNPGGPAEARRGVGNKGSRCLMSRQKS